MTDNRILMNLKTVFCEKELEWHDHFLWIPKKVFTYLKQPDSDYVSAIKVQWLWLETVKRKNTEGFLKSTLYK